MEDRFPPEPVNQDPDLARLIEMDFKPPIERPAQLAPYSSQHLFNDVRRWTYRHHKNAASFEEFERETTLAAYRFAWDEGVRSATGTARDLAPEQIDAVAAKCARWTWTNLHK